MARTQRIADPAALWLRLAALYEEEAAETKNETKKERLLDRAAARRHALTYKD